MSLNSATGARNSLRKILSAISSYPIVGAALIVLALNAWFLWSNPVKSTGKETGSTAHTWVWWAFQDYKNRQPKPDIVMLGSSVMMHPTWFQEATFRKQDVEIIVDHRSRYLESVIKAKEPAATGQAFNFALPGGMISDDYIVAKTLCAEQHKPKIIVLGVGPRDFIDNSFHCPAGSRHFQYLSSFTEVKQPDELLIPQWWDRPKYWLQRAVYFKEKSKDIQTAAGDALRQAMAPVLSQLRPSPLDKLADSKNALALYKDELERGFWIAHPKSPHIYVESAWDAQRRVSKPNNSMFKNQQQWLELLLQECKQNDVEVIIVNMPLTPLAVRVVGAKPYERHLALLQDATKRWGAALIDLNARGGFVEYDYGDWVHMTDTGGEKILSAVGNHIAADKKMLARLIAAPATRLSSLRPTAGY